MENAEISGRKIEDELARVLGSVHFAASERNRNFLRYVVEETLAGRSSRIKAYSIATSVFGRDERFDPQHDAIVRIEANRLRRALEHYYLTGGRDDPLRIEIPRGSYVPAFVPPEEPPRPSRRLDGQPPAILVAAFDEEGDGAGFAGFARGFTRSLIVALARFTGLRVYGAETALQKPADVDPQSLRHDIATDYLLTGGCLLGQDRLVVDALLLEAHSGRAVWADRFERRLRPSEILDLRDELANHVARTLAQPYGVIQSDRVQDADGAPPETLGSYDTVLRFYRYMRTFDRSMLESLRAGLERTIAAEPGYAEAFACLSLLYVDIVRFQFPVGAPGVDPQERALVLARRAVELAPNSSWARYALGLATWFAGDTALALAILEAAHALNPNDTTILGELGLRYVLAGDVEKGVPLIEDSYAWNPAQTATFRMGLFFGHYSHGRYAEALAQARQVEAPHVLYGHVAVAAAAAGLGDRAAAAAAIASILAIDPDYGEHAAADLAGRGLAPALSHHLIAGLAKAGLPGLAAPDVASLEDRRVQR